MNFEITNFDYMVLCAVPFWQGRFWHFETNWQGQDNVVISTSFYFVIKFFISFVLTEINESTVCEIKVMILNF